MGHANREKMEKGTLVECQQTWAEKVSEEKHWHRHLDSLAETVIKRGILFQLLIVVVLNLSRSSPIEQTWLKCLGDDTFADVIKGTGQKQVQCEHADSGDSGDGDDRPEDGAHEKMKAEDDGDDEGRW